MLELAKKYIKTSIVNTLHMYKKLDRTWKIFFNTQIKLLDMKTAVSKMKDILEGINSN